MSVIPDSIDPVYGWRHWNVGLDALVSPQHIYCTWPQDKAFIFECMSSPTPMWASSSMWGTWQTQQNMAASAQWHWAYTPNPAAPQSTWPHGGWTVVRGGGYTPEQLSSGRTEWASVPGLYGVPYPQTQLPSGYGYTWTTTNPPPQYGQPTPPPKSKPHTVPVKGCGCGIYAVKTLDDLYSQRSMPWWVVGRVAMWGTVIEGERGYRAEKAYPAELYVYTPSWPKRAWPAGHQISAKKRRRHLKVAKRYGVPVKTYKGWQELFAMSGADR